jgi:hypothetical protein
MQSPLSKYPKLRRREKQIKQMEMVQRAVAVTAAEIAGAAAVAIAPANCELRQVSSLSKIDAKPRLRMREDFVL